MKRLLLIALLILIPTQGRAEAACFSDADGVRQHSPGAWPSWTMNMPKHKGERCWFPSNKNDKKWHDSHIAQPVEHRTLTAVVPDSNSGVAAIPLPRPRSGYAEITLEQGNALAFELDQMIDFSLKVKAISSMF